MPTARRFAWFAAIAICATTAAVIILRAAWPPHAEDGHAAPRWMRALHCDGPMTVIVLQQAPTDGARQDRVMGPIAIGDVRMSGDIQAVRWSWRVDALHISADRAASRPTLVLAGPGISKVVLRNGAALTYNGLRRQNLSIDSDGAAPVLASGYAQDIAMNLTGAGDIDARGLNCNGLRLIHDGSGEILLGEVDGACEVQMGGTGRASVARIGMFGPQRFDAPNPVGE